MKGCSAGTKAKGKPGGGGKEKGGGGGERGEIKSVLEMEMYRIDGGGGGNGRGVRREDRGQRGLSWREGQCQEIRFSLSGDKTAVPPTALLESVS